MNVDTGSFTALTAEVSALRGAVQGQPRTRIVLEEVFEAGVEVGRAAMRAEVGVPARRTAPRAATADQRRRHLRAVDSNPGGVA